MRLWHYELIPYLPNSQLLAQKRECDLIWSDLAKGKQTNHILINYMWQYKDPATELCIYYSLLAAEFEKRGFKFNYKIPDDVVDDGVVIDPIPFYRHHNFNYLLQCFYNLEEKYERGQKDFSKEQYNKLEQFIKVKGGTIYERVD